MAIVVSKTVKPLKLKANTIGWHPAGGWVSPFIQRKPAAAKKKTTTTTIGGAPATGGDMLSNLIASYTKSMLTPQQQQTQATQSVNSQIAQALAGIKATTAEQVRAANRQAERAQGFAEGLRTLSPNMGAQIQSYYNDAAGQLQNFGSGLTGAVGAAQQADADKATSDIAQATGGQGVVGGYSIPDLKNIAQYTGVYLPSATLAGQGANEAAGEFMKNVSNSQAIGNIAQTYLQNANDATTNLADQRAQLELTRPGLMQTAVNSLSSGNRQDMATLISALALQGTNAQIPSKIANTVADTAGKKATTAGTVAKTTATKTGTKVTITKASGETPSGNPAPGNYWVGTNPKTRVAAKIPPHQKLDPNDPTHSKLIPDANNPPSGMHYDPATGTFVVNPSKSSAKGTTPSQVSTILNRARGEVAKVILGPPYSQKTDIYNPAGPSYKPLLSISQARTRLLKAYFPRALWKNAQALGIVNDALAQAGYTG